MFPAAHLGIGSTLGRAYAPKLPCRWLLTGTLLPDLIDKPFYLGMALVAHYRTGGWVPGKRGLAHTALFLLMLIAVAVWRKSPRWAALGVGSATHMVLDVLSKGLTQKALSGSLTVVFWPALGWHFPTLSFGLHGLWAAIWEGIGAALLLLQLCVRRYRPAVL
jgi:hypothetical protein